jgi:hypothetical protein
VSLGNAYPAIQLDDRGEQVDSGVVLQFTDDTDQPGSGGGGSQDVNASLRANGVGHNDAANFIGSMTGNIYSTVGNFAFASAMGQVADLGNFGYLLAGTVPSTNDNFDIQVTVSVTDATGTNQASAAGGFSVASPVTDLASSHNLAGGTWSVDVGVDLTVSGDILSSTAGGAFYVTVQVTGSWD